MKAELSPIDLMYTPAKPPLLCESCDVENGIIMSRRKEKKNNVFPVMMTNSYNNALQLLL